MSTNIGPVVCVVEGGWSYASTAPDFAERGGQPVTGELVGVVDIGFGERASEGDDPAPLGKHVLGPFAHLERAGLVTPTHRWPQRRRHANRARSCVAAALRRATGHQVQRRIDTSKPTADVRDPR